MTPDAAGAAAVEALEHRLLLAVGEARAAVEDLDPPGNPTALTSPPLGEVAEVIDSGTSETVYP